MDEAKRRALEAAGFRIGDVEDFLGLTEDERRLVDPSPDTPSPTDPAPRPQSPPTSAARLRGRNQ